MRYSVSERIFVFLLSIVMIFTMLPAMKLTAASVQENSQVVDEDTMNSWKTFFSPTDITTAHAGGVWTDKSVFKNSPFSSDAIKIDKTNNFLVALSAMGSNSVVIGQDYAPTDTMFVLDVSNSMSNSALSSMVTATNNAIRTLLAGAGNTNRVGVVLYGTTANVLLPLDHYTGVNIDGAMTFIQLNGNSIRAAQNSVWIPAEGSGSSGGSGNYWEDFWENILGGGNQGNGEYVTTYLTNQAGNAVTTSVSTGGGTYTQGGIWKAWEQFSGATDVSTDKVNAKRAPVIVLMCDGAATYSASDFDNVSDSATHGTGSASSTGDGFVTQLTAAYVKAKMAEKYNTDAFFYTLGLEVENIAIAQAILDPASKTAATDIDDAWKAFLQGSATVSLYRRGQGGGNQNVTIRNASDITFNENSYKYADKYFNASQATDLNQQFQNIVNEISLSAGYYPTHLDDNGANYSGYITFVDELGKGMEVKEIEGIVIGDNTYTGRNFARALVSGVFGTKQEPTDMGDEFVRAVKARLELTDNDEVWALLDYSYTTRGSLHYNSDSDWSNYIVWYGDANGEYLGYDESLKQTATYRNVCYGMLGVADEAHKVSDMMYVGIQVSTNLVSGDQTVTFRVPASMLPVVTYQISIDGNEVTKDTTATLNYHRAEPIRLVYEVGVKEEVTALNVADYAEKIGDKYYLYTNKWNQNPDFTDISTNHLSYAYFEPGADNEHYYFTENSVIYTDSNKSGTVASADALDINGTYYYEHYVFNQPTKNTDGTFAVKADFHLEKLSKDALTEAKSKAVVIDGKLCVPKGVMHYAHSHDLFKGAADSTATEATKNNTETFPYVRKQIVDAHPVGHGNTSGTGAKHYELIYMGNNGRLTVQPATGISITKLVDDTITDLSAAYTFDVTVTKADGNPLAGTFAQKNGETEKDIVFTGGVAEVTLKAGETVYIYNLPAGATYTISERYGDGYKTSAAVKNADTIVSETIQNAIFTNSKRGTGTLSIKKDVTGHPFATADIENIKFDFAVEMKKADGTPFTGDVPAVQSGVGNVTLQFDNAGKAGFKLHDNQELTITNLPEGTTYTVYELDEGGNTVSINGLAKTGYKLVSVAGGTTQNKAIGTIAADGLQYAHFVNQYEATPGSLELKVEITKILSGAALTQSENFQFKVERLDSVEAGYKDVTGEIKNISSTADPKTLTIDLSGQTYASAGTYIYRITEVPGTLAGMTYDSSRGLFAVKVQDINMNGILEMDVDTAASSNVEVIEPSGTEGHIVKKSFTNTYDVNATTATINIKKELVNETGVDILLTDFHFGLYSDASCSTMVGSPYTTGANGDAEISLHITEPGIKTYYLKEIPGSVIGMDYDPTVYEVVVNTEDVTASLVSTVSIYKYEGANTNRNVTYNPAKFKNEYKLNSVNATLSGEKKLEGRNWLSGEKYIVELYKTNAAFHYSGSPVDTKEMRENQKYAFDLGDFSGVGIYHYVVKEQIPGNAVQGKLNGILYDTAEYHVTVTVTPSATEAKLEATVTVLKLGGGSVAQNSLNFTNTYHTTSTTTVLSGRKEILNESSNLVIPPKGYAFELRENDGAGRVIDIVTSDANGNFSFKPLHFTAPGEYTYEIVEVGAGNTKVNGVTYNAANWNVTVVVKEDGLGALYVDGQRSNRGSNVFTNTYKAEGDTLGLSGIKELEEAEGTDRPLQANDFSFTLRPVGTAPMPGGKTFETVANGADGKFTFTDITFNEVGTYQYTITEEKEADGTNGIYYDKVVYTVTVDVADHGAGKLVAQVTSIIADKGLADETVKFVVDFYNIYYAKPAEVILSGNKVLENVTAGVTAGEKNIPLTGENLTKFPFNFKLEAVTEGAPMPNQATISCGENGAITFGAIAFNAVGQYRYTVKEIIPDNSVNGVLNGVTYTLQTHNITVTVTDNKQGQLVASVALEGNDKAFEADGKTAKVLSFRNTYAAVPPVTPENPNPGSVVFKGTKVLENVTEGIAAADKNMSLANKQFQFQLKDSNNNILGTVTTGTDGAFAFGPQVFQALGEYTYTITELKGDKAYITYVTQPITVKVNVTDRDLDSWMEISVTYDGADALTVTNRYAAEDTKLAFIGKKQLDTRAPKDGEFEFLLSSVNGAPMPGQNKTESVKNDASGNILFPEITFSAVGEYKYTIEEVTASDGYKGITYDKTVYDVTVTVTDGGEGKLIAVAKSVKQGQTEKADVVFFNKYQAAPTQVIFDGTKTLNGRELKDEEFSFILTDGNGVVLETVKNKDGKFTFAAQNLLKAGTYKFFIKEDVSAKKADITYDKAVYEMTVEVKDDGNGELSAEVTVKKDDKAYTGKPVFVNSYTPNTNPATGDVFGLMQMSLCMGVSSVAMLAVLLMGKKKRFADEQG